jgi:signal transduction histidine kinase/DNA-binding response OmpR family regulator
MTTALKILIIDDDKVDSIAVVRSISRSDIIAEVDSAFSAKEGFEKMEALTYDLIFLDYLMPDLDGISILKKLRSQGIESPVIFITSQGDENIASQAILAGASDYMPKTLLTSDGISHSIRNAIKLYESQIQRKKTELELKINANRLSEAQKLAKIGSWEIDLFSNTIFFSEELFNIIELDTKEKPCMETFKSRFTSDEDLNSFEQKLDELRDNPKEILFSHSILGKKGTTKYINEYIKCLNDDNNKPLKILGTIQDVSIQKEIEEELISAKNIAEQSVRLKERFLTNMSHEIRTPMNGIVGFAKILEDTNLDDNQQQSVEAIKTAGQNLMTIINDILDLSKIEADKMTFEAVPFSLKKTVVSVLGLFSVTAKDKTIKLLSNVDPEIQDLVIGDPTRLSQILINLVGNALKFTEEGTIELVVKKEQEDDCDSTIVFSVIDTGIGIPEDKVEAIFESFSQASNETTRKYGGTGLGLTITRKLVELQGGTIAVTSELGHGSNFTFKIKYPKAKEGDIDVIVDKKQKLDFGFLKNINILLVEDNELNQLLAVKLFKRWDKEIDIAENGKIAIEKIESNTYDIILMDIQMPEMDGNEVALYIRNQMPLPTAAIPIIAMTAHATADEEKRCLSNGMNDYLSKPFDFNVLLEKLFHNLNLSEPKELITVEKEAKVENSYEKMVNLDYLIDFTEGDADFIKEIITLFIQNTPLALKLIVDYNDIDDLENLKREVHKFKSSVSLLGIQEAMNSVLLIEEELMANPSGSIRKTEVQKLNEICLKAVIELEEQTEF